MHDDLCLAERRLDRLGRTEDFGKFLERPTTGFNVEEVDEGELERVPEDEEEVVLCHGLDTTSDPTCIGGIGQLTFHPAPANAIPVTKVV
jgi:hypothetical protein